MRTIESHSAECRELDSAVALAVALIIDPDMGRASAAFPEPLASARPGDATRPTWNEPAGLPAPVAPAAAMPVATYQPTCPEPTPVALMVGASLAQDLLPGLAPGFSIAMDVGFGSALHGRLGAVYAPERRKRDATMDFALGLTAASLGICYETRGALGPVACASLPGRVTVGGARRALTPGLECVLDASLRSSAAGRLFRSSDGSSASRGDMWLFASLGSSPASSSRSAGVFREVLTEVPH